VSFVVPFLLCLPSLYYYPLDFFDRCQEFWQPRRIEVFEVHRLAKNGGQKIESSDVGLMFCPPFFAIVSEWRDSVAALPSLCLCGSFFLHL